MAVPSIIIELVSRFERNSEEYKGSEYKEARLRQEFIDPFFKALGWDINNEQGFAEAYKEVVHEDSVRVGTELKAPDYCFRIGGTRKFFVEAKKPAVHIKDEHAPAYQVRRYAWTAKLPLSILTNFAEMAVYDTRIKPTHRDKSSTTRTLYITCAEYAERWDEIASIFSKDSILKGSFDRYAEKNKSKRGTTQVDTEFLTEIEEWRLLLARNLAIRNENLDEKSLNFSVQRIIDRIVFLRICEDRGLEEYGRLKGLLQTRGSKCYEQLGNFFYEADQRYNSGLFHFDKESGRNEPPDALTLALKLDDAPLHEIVKRLYYPDSPYAFSVFPAEILGQVYEQFLGKVIRLTAGHKATVEEKPEVRKAGGVYYTPSYIVDYIVKESLGNLLKDKTEKQVSKIKVLDPACGSGSFLLGAYQYLLDWHLDWYLKNQPAEYAEKKRPPLIKINGVYKLSTAERKRILLNNIFGVDIDSQAVEVSKLSLLLKVLEGETAAGMNDLLIHKERALPDLGKNIKCGNTLIGADVYVGQQLQLFSDIEQSRINAFDWATEFPEIMRAGGFDCVIGNPPYGFMIQPIEKEYFDKNYSAQDYQKDLYTLFLEKYHTLLHQHGLLGIIVSNTWLQSILLKKIRVHLVQNYDWLRILLLPEKVFAATVDTQVLIFRRKNAEESSRVECQIDIRKNEIITFSHGVDTSTFPTDGSALNIATHGDTRILCERILHQNAPLSQICDVYNGIKPFEKNKGTPPQTKKTMETKPFVAEGKRPGKDWSPLLRGSLISRYDIRWDRDYWIHYGPWLAAPRKRELFMNDDYIAIRQTGDSLIATLVPKGFYARDNLHIIHKMDKNYSLEYVLGLLNSKLLNLVYSYMNPEKGEALAQVKKFHVAHVPIRVIDFSNKADKREHDAIKNWVSQILTLRSKIKTTTAPHSKVQIERQIAALESAIDKTVYKLYGLSDSEVQLIENC